MAVNEKLFEVLKEKKITQKKLSKMTGIPESTISDWKRKGKTPGTDKLVQVCKAINVSPNEILGDVDFVVQNDSVKYLIEQVDKMPLEDKEYLYRYLHSFLVQSKKDE